MSCRRGLVSLNPPVNSRASLRYPAHSITLLSFISLLLFVATPSGGEYSRLQLKIKTVYQPLKVPAFVGGGKIERTGKVPRLRTGIPQDPPGGDSQSGNTAGAHSRKVRKSRGVGRIRRPATRRETLKARRRPPDPFLQDQRQSSNLLMSVRNFAPSQPAPSWFEHILRRPAF
jgi:hypothetical protein